MVSRIKPCSYFLNKYPILENERFCKKFPHIVLTTAIIHSLNEFHKQASDLYKGSSGLENPNPEREENYPEIFPEFEKIGVGKSIGKYLSLLESCSYKSKNKYNSQEQRAIDLYQKISKEISDEENAEREMTKYFIKSYFSVTPKEYFNLITDIRSKQEKDVKLNDLEKRLIDFYNDSGLNDYLLDLKAKTGN